MELVRNRRLSLFSVWVQVEEIDERHAPEWPGLLHAGSLFGSSQTGPRERCVADVVIEVSSRILGLRGNSLKRLLALHELIVRSDNVPKRNCAVGK